MKMSDSIEQLANALCQFQAEVSNPERDSKNPFFSSKYTSLASLIDHTRELLSRHGLAISQLCGNGTVSTVLMHKSGEYLCEETQLVLSKKDMQGLGSAITYARRYAVAAILGIASEDDDDGNAASTKPNQSANPFDL